MSLQLYYSHFQEFIFGPDPPDSPGQFVACIFAGVTSLITASIYNLIPKNQNNMSNMSNLRGLSATLTGQSPLVQYPSGDAQDILDQLSENNQRPLLDCEENYPEGFDPEHDPTLPSCHPLICHPLDQFEQLAMEISRNIDPLSETILKSLKSCGEINMTFPNLLLERYKYLIRVSAKDWELIKGTLHNAFHHGYSSSLSCIEGMITVYGLQNAKIADTHIKTLGDIVDDMKVSHRNDMRQHGKDKEFLEQITVQNNHVLKAMGDLMEKLDQKTLEFSRPTPSTSAIISKAPTTDSQSSKQGRILTMIKEIPNTKFSTSDLSISFDHNLRMTFTPQTHRGKRLAPLFQLDLKNSSLIRILNLDLDQLGSRVSTIPDITSRFLLANMSERRNIINNLCKDVSPTHGQWIQSVANN